ncbi:MAG: D-sedoheptulose 7-phosphate isomerase [Candidatus Omnitrophica bacterium]|nr:D-sedoheptulose 7-phosphate isomerase [Candidatus Omnitrophota bacterium]
MQSFVKQVQQSLQDSIETKRKLMDQEAGLIVRIAQEMAGALKEGRKILLFGNGGSAADAQHIAAELVGRFMAERPSWPALALTANTSTLTAIGNDYGYEQTFSRQVEGLGKPGDVAVGISTSGKSPNVLRAIRTAKTMGLKTVALTGGHGGPLAQAADLALVVPSHNTQRIQETHITVGHILCEIIEGELLNGARKNQAAERVSSSHH